MFSIYSCILSSTKIYNYKFLDKFCDFGEEVVISTDNEEIYKKLHSFQKNNLIISKYTPNINNRCYISEILNNSLSLTTNPIKICLNIYEYIPINQKSIWNDMSQLLSNDIVSAYAIPLFSLSNNKYEYIKSKWYIHKSDCHRGTAIVYNKDYSDISDCLDLIDESGHFVPFKSLQYNTDVLENNSLPFVLQAVSQQ